MQNRGTKYLIGLLFLVIAFAVMVPGSGAQLAAPNPGVSSGITSMNVCGRNNSGQTANDLELYIKGNVNVVDYWNKDKFNDITTSYDPTTDTTTVRFYNGTVFDGEEIHACIKINGPDTEERVRTWTLDGKPIGPVGPTLSTNFGLVKPGLLNINLANLAKDGGPFTIAEFQYGPGKRVYQLSELLWDNPVLNQEIPWGPMQKYHVNVGEGVVVPEIPIPNEAAVVVYRAKVFFDKDPGKVFEYVGQYDPVPLQRPFYALGAFGRNNTGQTANDMEFYAKGHVHVLNYWLKDKFNNVYTYYDPVTDTTTIRFYNGTVFDGEQIHVAMLLDQPYINQRARTWTLDGKPIGPHSPGFSTRVELVKPSVASISLGNYAKDGGPVTIAEFQYGPGNRVYELPELLWDNPILNQEIPWSPSKAYHLSVGEMTAIPYVPFPDPAVVMVYRAKVFLDADPNNVVEYVGEIRP